MKIEIPDEIVAQWKDARLALSDLHEKHTRLHAEAASCKDREKYNALIPQIRSAASLLDRARIRSDEMMGLMRARLGQAVEDFALNNKKS